jgi:hypothetical protein
MKIIIKEKSANLHEMKQFAKLGDPVSIWGYPFLRHHIFFGYDVYNMPNRILFDFKKFVTSLHLGKLRKQTVVHGFG